MNTEKTYNTTLTAALDFFGLQPSQNNLGFGKEFQALTQDDKTEINRGLIAIGYKIAAV